MGEQLPARQRQHVSIGSAGSGGCGWGLVKGVRPVLFHLLDSFNWIHKDRLKHMRWSSTSRAGAWEAGNRAPWSEGGEPLGQIKPDSRRSAGESRPWCSFVYVFVFFQARKWWIWILIYICRTWPYSKNYYNKIVQILETIRRTSKLVFLMSVAGSDHHSPWRPLFR